MAKTAEKYSSKGMAARKQLARLAIIALAKDYPHAWNHGDAGKPFESLVFTILSAQTTDKAVDKVVPELFSRYPNPAKLAKAKQADVEKIIKSIGLHHAKAKNIIASAKQLIEDFAGEVPHTIPELIRLPGVGRKTANCVLVNGFGMPGIMCDTHCCRLSRRLGLTKSLDPEKVETDLASLMQPEEWANFSHRIILHGREICHARKPECGKCSMKSFCPSAEF